MPNFAYKARNENGQESQGTREAASEEELISALQNEGLLVISVVREELFKTKGTGGRYFHTRVTIDDLIMFSRQLATMLEAGVTLLKSLDVLTKQIESRKLLEAAEDIKHSIASGNTFRDALIRHPKIFTDFWVHIVETGEASGALPVTLAQLADYLETNAAMRRKVTSALIYPAVLIGLSMVALTVFTVWIIPIFARVFESFNLELPAITVLVMNFSNFVRKFFLVLLVMFGVLVFMFFKYLQTENGKWQFDRIMLKVPILSSLFQRIAIERFASGLGTLIESGVPILYGLDIVGKAVGNKVMEEGIKEVRESVRQGKGMARPLGKNPIFTPMVVQMVAVGEEIGELGKMLRKVSEFYKERIATALERITTLIEPLVLVFMGGVVGVMVVSMFMPIFQLAMLSKG